MSVIKQIVKHADPVGMKYVIDVSDGHRLTVVVHVQDLLEAPVIVAKTVAHHIKEHYCKEIDNEIFSLFMAEQEKPELLVNAPGYHAPACSCPGCNNPFGVGPQGPTGNQGPTGKQPPPFPGGKELAGPSTPEKLKDLYNAVPALINTKVACPQPYPYNGEDNCVKCPTEPTPLSNIIMHLNDSHNWTRAQIADWLETLDADLTFKEKINAPLDPTKPLDLHKLAGLKSIGSKYFLPNKLAPEHLFHDTSS